MMFDGFLDLLQLVPALQQEVAMVHCLAHVAGAPRARCRLRSRWKRLQGHNQVCLALQGCLHATPAEAAAPQASTQASAVSVA